MTVPREDRFEQKGIVHFPNLFPKRTRRRPCTGIRETDRIRRLFFGDGQSVSERFLRLPGVSTRCGRGCQSAVGLFLRIGECSFKNENPKLKRSIWDHVFLPCEQSADEPHGSMIYMPSDRIGKPLRRHSWLSGGWRIQRDPSDPTPHHASHSGQVCFAPKRHTHLGVTRRTLLLDSTTVATTATPEAGRRPNSTASDRDVSRRRRRRIRPRTYGNISSAMMTALSAAPRSSWSPHTKRSRPYSPNTSFLRTRPTSTSYLVDAVSGIG